jgi:uncharacterized Fe-S radical SAM superfamily protein PflX
MDNGKLKQSVSLERLINECMVCATSQNRLRLRAGFCRSDDPPVGAGGSDPYNFEPL